MPAHLLPFVLKATGAIAISALTALASRYVSRHMTVRIARQEQEHIEVLATKAVRFSEQRHKAADNAEKLRVATSELKRTARKAGIHIKRKAAEYEIEVALQRYKMETAPNDSNGARARVLADKP